VYAAKKMTESIDGRESIPLQILADKEDWKEDSTKSSESSLHGSGPARLKQTTGHMLAGIRENWRGLAALVCLWVGYFMVNTAYSLFAPFFPAEVRPPLQK
jgi:hypothetical protein